jgi:hypothetical protein
MLWKEITAGFLIAGFVALVPETIFQDLFLRDAPDAVRTAENVLVGPLIAVLSFVCSIGNIPLAAILIKGGVGTEAAAASAQDERQASRLTPPSLSQIADCSTPCHPPGSWCGRKAPGKRHHPPRLAEARSHPLHRPYHRALRVPVASAAA